MSDPTHCRPIAFDDRHLVRELQVGKRGQVRREHLANTGVSVMRRRLRHVHAFVIRRIKFRRALNIVRIPRGKQIVNELPDRLGYFAVLPKKTAVVISDNCSLLSYDIQLPDQKLLTFCSLLAKDTKNFFVSFFIFRGLGYVPISCCHKISVTWSIPSFRWRR
jgi:hypothetical protein